MILAAPATSRKVRRGCLTSAVIEGRDRVVVVCLAVRDEPNGSGTLEVRGWAGHMYKTLLRRKVLHLDQELQPDSLQATKGTL